jgi:hypothetical protein
MNPEDPVSSVMSAVKTSLDQARSQAREQLAAAWQLHITRVEDELKSRWGAHLETLLNERFGELGQRLTGDLEESFKQRMQDEVAAARADERRLAIGAVSEHLNAAARRLKTVERQDDWNSAVVDAALGFCDRATVFSIQGPFLRLEHCSQPVSAWEAPLVEAPAIHQAVEALEPMVAAYSTGQISSSLAGVLGQVAPRLYIFPVTSQGKAVGVLTAEGDTANVDPNALELLASIASAVYEIRYMQSQREQNATGLVNIGDPVPLVPPPRPLAEPLSQEEQDRHNRAQRFARVHVAEIRLYKSQSVKEGRAAKNLYGALKDDIDRSRHLYRQQFMDPPNGMPDYLHSELLKTLANDDVELLGDAYPGSLA